MWKRSAEKHNFANFHTLDCIIEDEDEQEDMPLVDQICTHLDGLMTSFYGYFSHGDLNVASGWIRYLFLFNLDSIEDEDMAKDELIELKENRKVKMELTTFLCHQLNVFVILAERAVNLVVPFVTTYLCESGAVFTKKLSTKFELKY